MIEPAREGEKLSLTLVPVPLSFRRTFLGPIGPTLLFLAPWWARRSALGTSQQGVGLTPTPWTTRRFATRAFTSSVSALVANPADNLCLLHRSGLDLPHRWSGKERTRHGNRCRILDLQSFQNLAQFLARTSLFRLREQGVTHLCSQFWTQAPPCVPELSCLS